MKPTHSELFPTWTIAKLIEELQKYPPETEVKTEGCDCWGEVGSVQFVAAKDGYIPSPAHVIIERPIEK